MSSPARNTVRPALLRLEGLTGSEEPTWFNLPCRGDGKTHVYEKNGDGSVTVLPMVVTCRRCNGRGCMGGV